MLKIMVADDHPLFRDAIKDVVAQMFGARGWDFQVMEATRASEVLAMAGQEDDLDLILLDLAMPGAEGLSALLTLRARAPATPIVVISSTEDRATMRQAMACGAAGFIPKSSPASQIGTALETVFAGGVYLPDGLADETTEKIPKREEGGDSVLTSRQLAVLSLLSRGLSNKSIARDLNISDLTVKAHVTAILRKLGVSSRAQAIAALRHQGAP